MNHHKSPQTTRTSSAPSAATQTENSSAFDLEFECSANGQAQVTINQELYVQLLVCARESDPRAWPPGLENGARLVARAREIEEDCIARRGEFTPEKLSAKARNEYFKIHLALDELQEAAAVDSRVTKKVAAKSRQLPVLPDASWQEFSINNCSENFA